MAQAPLDELHFLTAALQAHVEWTKATGAYGVPACDATWLEARREHYRRTPYVVGAISEATDETTSPPQFTNAGGDAATQAEPQAPEPQAPEPQAPAPQAPEPQAPEPQAPPGVAVAAFEASAVEAAPPQGRAHESSAHEEASVLEATAPSQGAPPDKTTAPAVDSPSGPPSLARTRASAPSPAGVEIASLLSSRSSANASSNDGRVAEATRTPLNVSANSERSQEQTAQAITPPVALDPEERRARLLVLENEVRQCRACGLCEGRTNTVFARGDGSAGVAFVGEGPGADEDAQGYPFVGAAGQLLDKMIAAMGLTRESVYVCNIVKCRPPKNRKPSEEEMAACRHYVVSQLELIQPKVIVALGATAVEGLLGVKLGITRMRGTWRLYKGTIPVMPTFHPAYLLRQPEAKRDVWEDLQAVLTRINMPIPQRRR